MYKIYINEMPLYIVASDDANLRYDVEGETLLIPYLGNPKVILQIYKICDHPGRVKQIYLYGHRPRVILNAIRKQIKEVVAAGGIVFNELDEVLFIYRRGFWDLPKGKIDDGETVEAAAVREVMEETGIKDVVLGEEIGVTYHIFKTINSGGRILKKTIWFKMKTHKQPIKVQKEEDIEDAIWKKIDDFKERVKPVYNNIIDIINTVELG